MQPILSLKFFYYMALNLITASGNTGCQTDKYSIGKIAVKRVIY